MTLAIAPIRRHVGGFMVDSVALFGAATLVLGATTSVPVTLVALCLLDVGDMASV